MSRSLCSLGIALAVAACTPVDSTEPSVEVRGLDPLDLVQSGDLIIVRSIESETELLWVSEAGHVELPRGTSVRLAGLRAAEAASLIQRELLREAEERESHAPAHGDFWLPGEFEEHMRQRSRPQR